MKFETIKEKAKVIFREGVQQYGGKGSQAAFDALLAFALATKAEREEMRDFAENFQAHRTDWLAQSAKRDQPDQWGQMVLRAREAGLQLIDNWDVRMVGKLIELFPESVPARYRGKQLTCYMADNEDCDWMVEVDEPREEPDHLRPAMRM